MKTGDTIEMFGIKGIVTHIYIDIAYVGFQYATKTHSTFRINIPCHLGKNYKETRMVLFEKGISKEILEAYCVFNKTSVFTSGINIEDIVWFKE